MIELDLHSRPALAPHVRLQVDPVSNEPVLLFSEGVLVLNETAQAIVQCCNGKSSVREIIAFLGAEYEIDEETLKADALGCLRDLVERNLVVLK